MTNFSIAFIPIDRGKYDRHNRLVELSLERSGSEALVEALMELALLARSRLVGGSMLGNMPRLAMQLRVQPPATSPLYVTLDGHRWCTTSSCKPYTRAHEAQVQKLRAATKSRRATNQTTGVPLPGRVRREPGTKKATLLRARRNSTRVTSTLEYPHILLRVTGQLR